MLESNSKKDIPVHLHLLQMQDYSHLFVGTPIERLYLSYTHLPNEAWSNLLTILVYSPTLNCFTNTLSEKRYRTPFYKALFTAREEIHPFVAVNPY
jgi:hypothetical protein